MCHLIFFLPFFGLAVFWFFPFKTALILYLMICAISLFLYYKVFQAMRVRIYNGMEAMLGKTAVAIQEIDPEGKIKYATEIWNAMTQGQKISEGEEVVINGFSGMSLIVHAVPSQGRVNGMEN